jgi:DNA-binding MarR family transcriptional regulator
MLHPDRQETMEMRERLRTQLRILSGSEDTSGIELSQMIRVAANMYDAVSSQTPGGDALSDPRWRVLLYLSVAEKKSGAEGMTPSSLSRYQNVSKNAVSSLLRGLEAQGLIEREIDGVDKRFFHIRLSAAGRDAVLKATPVHAAQLNRMAGSLTSMEREQLIGLLEKLIHSLIVRDDVNIKCDAE